jgi:hypothetical protein
MAYLKPPLFVRKVFNPVAMRFGVGGAQALVVERRTSGGSQRVPVIPVEHEGARYLVCPRGETEWVKNLRAAGGVGELEPDGRFTATEVPVGERGPILDHYREVAGAAVKGLFEKLPDPADHPVFRIELAPARPNRA